MKMRSVIVDWGKGLVYDWRCAVRVLSVLTFSDGIGMLLSFTDER